MSRMKKVILSPRTGQIRVTSEDNIYKIKINNEDKILPPGYDITGIEMAFPPELQEVRLWIGGQDVAIFDREKLNDLERFPIYLTQLQFHAKQLHLVYDKAWLEQREEFVEEDVYEEVIDYDNKIKIFDGNEYYMGHPVKQIAVRKRVSKGYPVGLSAITFNLERNTSSSSDTRTYTTPVQQKINISDVDNNTLERWKAQHNLRVLDDTYGVLTNTLYYSQGLAGLKYFFATR